MGLTHIYHIYQFNYTQKILGEFEVFINGMQIYSKQKLGDFPAKSQVFLTCHLQKINNYSSAIFESRRHEKINEAQHSGFQ